MTREASLRSSARRDPSTGLWTGAAGASARLGTVERVTDRDADEGWLPRRLRAAAFTTATARDAGVPGWRLRQPHLVRPTRSIRAAVPLTTPVERAQAFSLALPDDAAFSHVTAAQLWGLSLPWALEAQELLDVMRPSARTRVRRTGCVPHRGLERRSLAAVRRCKVTGLADTWVDLGECLDRGLGLDDLIVIGDQAATRLAGRPEPGGAVDHEARTRGIVALERALTARVRPRGKGLLTEALSWVRAPVRSPMETRTRLMFVRAGFPEPVVNLDVFGPGGWLLEGDLVWRERRVIAEYQGADHGSMRRRSHDATRALLAGDEGWRVIEVFAEDVYQRPRRVACLRRFAQALGVDPARLHIT